MALDQYNGIIKKIDTAFADLFSDIDIAKYNDDGSVLKQFKVPIVFSGKEKFVSRLKGDIDLSRQFEVSLPRMTWEKLGFSYNPKRKLNSIQQQFYCVNGIPNAVYNPIPYDFNYNLYIYTRNVEDGNQILEYILPFFSPDFTIRANLVPSIGLINELPIILNAVQFEDSAEGGFDSETRTLIWTLNFTVHGYVYGNIHEVPMIKHTIENIYVSNANNTTITIGAGHGTFKQNEIVYSGMSLSNFTGKGILDNISNNILTISNIQGSFANSGSLKGVESLANYQIINIDTGYQLEVKYTADVVPANSTPLDPYVIVEHLSEYPNIA